jgi:hypothetical protein
MRKWTLPLTVVGLSGLGAVLLSKRGRKHVGFTPERSGENTGRLVAWNDSATDELHQIQQAVEELEHSFGTRTTQ